jgi:hypothetical protein
MPRFERYGTMEIKFHLFLTSALLATLKCGVFNNICTSLLAGTNYPRAVAPSLRCEFCFIPSFLALLEDAVVIALEMCSHVG